MSDNFFQIGNRIDADKISIQFNLTFLKTLHRISLITLFEDKSHEN